MINLRKNVLPTSPATMPDLETYCTVQEAAVKLEFTVQGVSKLIRQNKLEAVRVGKMYLVSKESVEKYRKATKGVSKRDPHRGKKPK